MEPKRRATRRAGVVLMAVAVLAGATSAVGTGVASASAPAQAQAQVVSPVPSAATPNVTNGAVLAMAEVDGRIVAGGSFTSVKSAGSGVAITRNFLLAFDATTGAVDQQFVPVVDGEVNAVVPSADGRSVYIGGAFINVNGVRSKSLARVQLDTGASTPGFVAPPLDGLVNDLRLSGGRLYLGGTFTKFGGTVPHAGLAAVNAGTGAADPSMNLQVAGHHNWEPGGQDAFGAVGVTKLDVTPDGQRMVAVGNFTSVSGLSRDQIVMIDLSGSTAAVDLQWATLAYTPPCFSRAYDSYMRAIQFSPDGSYFVVATTGGYYSGSFAACDAAARWNTDDTGADVQPAWLNQTGTDSLYSVAVTGTAVYIGGHQRWMNNPYGQDHPGSGAVPRPGIAALDPENGLPLSWNPGRNPRGHGAEALLATTSGLWVGSDTDFVGNEQYFRQRIAMFPLAGGTRLRAVEPATLPATIFAAGALDPPEAADAITARPYDGTSVGPSTTLAATGIAWSQVRGAFLTNGTLWYWLADGTLHRRSFDGTTFGPDAIVDPYNDPVWSDVLTKSGGPNLTYRGTATDFNTRIGSLTGVFFADGRIHYTYSGDRVLHSRAFTPDSGIVGAPEVTTDSSIDWSDVSGMFPVGADLYYATRSDGTLRRVAFTGGRPSGTPVVVSGPTADGQSWRNRAAFALPRPGAPTGVTGTAGDREVRLSWTAPTSPGVGVSGYVVTPFSAGTAGTPVTFTTLATTQTLTGLTNGQAYTFTVAATSSAGAGPASAPSGPVTPTGAASPNRRYVDAAYADFLARAPTADEGLFWTTALDNGTSRSQLVGGLASSSEWLTLTVNRLYLDTLGRPGDSGGVAFWVDQIQRRRETVASTAGQFYASNEYFAGFGESDLTTWVEDLYRKILHRDPDGGGVRYWTDRARANGRGDVSLAFYQSLESRRDRVSRLYEQLLDRLPDAGGLAFWSERILTSGDVALAADLASSDEYHRLAQARFP